MKVGGSPAIDLADYSTIGCGAANDDSALLSGWVMNNTGCAADVVEGDEGATAETLAGSLRSSPHCFPSHTRRKGWVQRCPPLGTTERAAPVALAWLVDTLRPHLHPWLPVASIDGRGYSVRQ